MSFNLRKDRERSFKFLKIFAYLQFLKIFYESYNPTHAMSMSKTMLIA